MKRTTEFVCFAASLVLLTMAASQAQEIKKYITPDGKTIYSDTPIPGAHEAGSVAPPPPIDPEDREEAEAAARDAAKRADELASQREDESAGQTSIEEAEQQMGVVAPGGDDQVHGLAYWPRRHCVRWCDRCLR